MDKELKRMASDFAGNRKLGAGHGWPSWEAQLLEKGFLAGAKSDWVENQKREFAIEFLYWVTYECFNTRSFKYKIGIKVSGGYLPGTVEYSVEELFQEFLKTKK